MTRHLRNTALQIFALRLAIVALAAAAMVSAPVPALAQDSAADARIRKVEAEVRALQRKVFPGADGRFFEPQITPGAPTPDIPAAQGIGAPSATGVTDILVRLGALEAQLRALTARSEEQANGLAQLELRIAAVENGNANSAGLPPLAAGRPVQTTPAQTNPAQTNPVGIRAPVPAATVPVPAAAAVAAPSATRLAAVQAITKPQTADAGDDEYSYGFRLWSAGFYPEARQQLTKYVEQYGAHPRISFGRNLLGRAFLDDNLPDDAARWFLRNYQANKNGDRAADSLLYLGVSMIAMKDTKRACIALSEFAETYPLIAAGRLANDYQVSRAKVTCS